MGLLLDLAYSGALALASPFLIYKALTRPRHTHGLSSRLGFGLPKPSDTPTIWVHGVSVGEILAAKTFIKDLEAAFPEKQIVISTTTSTGQEVARKTYPELPLFYFPIDFSWSVARVFESIRPELIVLVELELWPNFLEHARQRKVPVAVINGRISERSAHRYGLAPGFVRRMFQYVQLYCVQTGTYSSRFKELGVDGERIRVTDSMKYDNVRSPENIDAKALRARLGIEAGAKVLLGGSTHPSEERALLEIFLRLREHHDEQLRLILVPRHNERADEVEREIESLGERCLRFSKLDDRDPEQRPVILVDVIGELGRLYAAADFCFVGGSLIRHGGQNILEPASLGKAVLFGPHCFNFQESVDDLLDNHGAIQVQDSEKLFSALADLLAKPERVQDLGRQALATLEKKRGATQKTIAELSKLLGAKSPPKIETT